MSTQIALKPLLFCSCVLHMVCTPQTEGTPADLQRMVPPHTPRKTTGASQHKCQQPPGASLHVMAAVARANFRTQTSAAAMCASLHHSESRKSHPITQGQHAHTQAHTWLAMVRNELELLSSRSMPAPTAARPHTLAQSRRGLAAGINSDNLGSNRAGHGLSWQGRYWIRLGSCQIQRHSAGTARGP